MVADEGRRPLLDSDRRSKKDFRLAYGRTCYGTGYYIFWKVPPGFEHLSRPLESLER